MEKKKGIHEREEKKEEQIGKSRFPKNSDLRRSIEEPE